MSFARPDDMVREWLEKIYALAGPGSDMAKAALDEWDAQIDADGLLEEWGEKCGPDPDEVKARLERLDAIEELLEEAELIDAGDRETDPVPLLEMFLPVN